MQTERILLRPWLDTDAEALYKYASDPEVGKRAGWPPHKSVEESLEVIRTVFANDTTWAIVLRETGEAIGAMGYMPDCPLNLPAREGEPLVGYWVGRPYWNQGICTEALGLMIDHIRRNVSSVELTDGAASIPQGKSGGGPYTSLIGSHYIDNPASGRVMQKCGFRPTGKTAIDETLFDGAEHEMNILRLELTPSPLRIRLERTEDHREVENLTREAFWNVYAPGCVEHYVLHEYRTNTDFVPELDFVMELDCRIIGHVMFSRANIIKEDGSAIPAWTFGPISIHPDCQRRGYGLKLLRYALEKARAMGVGVVCMEGNIDFYRHAGFVLASTLGIHYHAEPKDAEVPYFLAQELIPGYLARFSSKGAKDVGTYHTPRGYYVAFEQKEAFDAYEATFPAKEKKVQEGQLPNN